MIYIHWLGLLIYTVVIAVAMVSVLMDRRQPAKTMAWMLVLMFMPVVGIILYFFFGQNTRKERIISQKSMDELTKRTMLGYADMLKDMDVPENERTLIYLFYQQSAALPFFSRETEIYTDGYQFFPALLKAIAQARHHIHLDTYIFADDPLGRLVADALVEKARQGVEVRLVYDDVGSWKTPNRFFEMLRENGVEVHAFMPVKFPAFTSKVNYRNHRKVCVVDGEIGFVGGMNIAQRYVKGVKRRKVSGTVMQPWRDTHIKVTGTAVRGLQRAFLVDWYFVDRTLVNGRKYYGEALGDGRAADGALMQLVTSNPTSPWPEIEQGYVRILLGARRYVYMETPYFLPTDPILFAMRTAALAGVDVRLMLPMHADAKLVEWASRSYVMETLEAGVKVYLYEPGFNHSKLLVSDDSLASVGSANIDFRSFENNFEANMFIYDRPLALRLKQVYLEDESHCVLIDDLTDLEHRPFFHRLWESLVRLLSPLL